MYHINNNTMELITNQRKVQQLFNKGLGAGFPYFHQNKVLLPLALYEQGKKKTMCFAIDALTDEQLADLLSCLIDMKESVLQKVWGEFRRDDIESIDFAILQVKMLLLLGKIDSTMAMTMRIIFNKIKAMPISAHQVKFGIKKDECGYMVTLKAGVTYQSDKHYLSLQTALLNVSMQLVNAQFAMPC